MLMNNKAFGFRCQSGAWRSRGFLKKIRSAPDSLFPHLFDVGAKNGMYFFLVAFALAAEEFQDIIVYPHVEHSF
jgi:hypothetical protein